MGTYYVYASMANKALTKQIDLVNDTIKVALVTGSYVPNTDTRDEWNDASAFESNGSGYTAGGNVLSSKTLTYDATKNEWTWDAADTSWTNANLTFRYAVLYDDTATGKPLIAYVDFGTAQTVTNQNVTIRWEISEQDPDSGSFYFDSGILRVSL
ncbi:hypothetical protein ACGFX8_13665 [Streptomyces sp. NPDC048362]|uniref:hypothetical protein n=1 Tax=Streptomyces sp. NPDC048362 TaxID=3365539 RepID=UPI003716A8F5